MEENKDNLIHASDLIMILIHCIANDGDLPIFIHESCNTDSPCVPIEGIANITFIPPGSDESEAETAFVIGDKKLFDDMEENGDVLEDEVEIDEDYEEEE